MNRTFSVGVLALTLGFLTTAAAHAEQANGQATGSGPSRFFYPSPLVILILRYLIWRKTRAEESQWNASNEQWGTSRNTVMPRSNGVPTFVVIAVIVFIVGLLAGIFFPNNRGGECADQQSPGITLSPLPVAPERPVAARRVYLGVRFRDIDAEMAAKVDVREGVGVQVTHVSSQSPAAKCGLKLNDIILSIADKPVHGGSELQKLVAELPLDQPIEAVISRGGKTMTLELTVEAEPDKSGSNLPRGKK